MNRPLHRELLDVLETHSQSEIARETSLSKGLVNSWANTELQEEGEYRPTSRDDERLRDLRAFAADYMNTMYRG